MNAKTDPEIRARTMGFAIGSDDFVRAIVRVKGRPQETYTLPIGLIGRATHEDGTTEFRAIRAGCTVSSHATRQEAADAVIAHAGYACDVCGAPLTEPEDRAYGLCATDRGWIIPMWEREAEEERRANVAKALRPEYV